MPTYRVENLLSSVELNGLLDLTNISVYKFLSAKSGLFSGELMFVGI